MTSGREQEEWLRQLFAPKGGEAQMLEQAWSHHVAHPCRVDKSLSD